MLEANTNFARLMNLPGVKSVGLCTATGADKTLISRWRSGKDKLTPKSIWTEKIARILMDAAVKRNDNALPGLLRSHYPFESLDIHEWLDCVDNRIMI